MSLSAATQENNASSKISTNIVNPLSMYGVQLELNPSIPSPGTNRSKVDKVKKGLCIKCHKSRATIFCQAKGCLVSYHKKCLPIKQVSSSETPEEKWIRHNYNCSEFHSSSISSYDTSPPPTSSITEEEYSNNIFYCSEECDPLGTTNYLIQYFDAIDEARSDFASSKDFVQELLLMSANSIPDLDSTTTKKGKKGKHHNTQCWNLSYILSSNSSSYDTKRKLRQLIFPYDNQLKSNIKCMDSNPSPISIPKSELDNMTQYYKLIMNSSKYSSKYSCKDIIDKNDLQSHSNNLSPEFFVGKTLELYCPYDEKYHIGRILDWRLATHLLSSSSNSHHNEKDDIKSTKDIIKRSTHKDDGSESRRLFFGKGRIGSCEFLVRFASGLNGRKKTLLKWMILEEHRCLVNAMVLLGYSDSKNSEIPLDCFTGGQLLLRTSLALLHPIGNNDDSVVDPSQVGLVKYFGAESKPPIYHNLGQDAIHISSTKQFKYNLKNKLTRSIRFEGLRAAAIELEEQRRVHYWYTLALDDNAHPRALSLRDESSLLPLNMNREECTTHDEDGNLLLSEFSQNEKEKLILPQPCPLIETGLDRIWISELIKSNFGDDFDLSLDAVSSLKCNRGSSKTKLVAHLTSEQSNKKIKI